jgi:TRAP-type C4-dicarboxylate transport system substrate-binding protein
MEMNRFLLNNKIRCLAIILLLLTSNPLFAQRTIRIGLASLVPENTAWGMAINRMAADWAKATNNEVQVVVFHGGTAGDEPEVLRKLRLNQIQAAVFTSVGLTSVTPEVMAISYPFMIRNDAELNEVMTRLKPDLDARMQKSGFVPLAWAHAGWIKFFSKTPVYTPSDLRKLKLATGTEEEMLQAFRIMGYQMVSVHLNQLISDLNSGRIDAVYQSPIYAAGGQVFGIAKHMADINVAPFMGGILINETAWRRIPERYKPELLAICKRMERDIESSIFNLENEAITTMARYGLQINRLTPQQSQEWYDDLARYENRLVGGSAPVFNRDFYNRISVILADYRRGN